MQGRDFTSDVIGQFHNLVLRIQDFHGLSVGVVADRERPGDFGSKFPGSTQLIISTVHNNLVQVHFLFTVLLLGATVIAIKTFT